VRLHKTLTVPAPNKFQSTHAHGVRHNTRIFKAGVQMFQSTHAHGVRHSLVGFCLITICVSIHARTRRATGHFLILKLLNPVSIHARTRRATSKSGDNAMSFIVSIHARTRRATSLIFCKYRSINVSIHARTRRATLSSTRPL